MINYKQKKFYTPVFLNHLIFLNEEQRYKVYEGEQVEAVGSLYQSSFVKQKTIDENIIRRETFLKYKIDNRKSPVELEVLPNYYRIHIPLKNINVDNIESNSKNEYFMEDILNEEDAGKRQIAFISKTIYKNTIPNLIFIHNVEIKDIEFFEKSICFLNY